MSQTNFVQLPPSSCQYLLELIESMDGDTLFTARQRSYTIPKLQGIAKQPGSARLAVQDVNYLLDLVEDDELESSEQVRTETLLVLQQIAELQNQRALEMQDIDAQRAARRAKRNPTTLTDLEAKFNGSRK